MYQSRLRIYEITNEDFSILPQNQFGFVLCWEIFNFLSLEKIEQHIRQVFDLLRPGGVFMFSYNNCDIYSIARVAESRDISYAQDDLLKNLCLNIGYEIIGNLPNTFGARPSTMTEGNCFVIKKI